MPTIVIKYAYFQCILWCSGEDQVGLGCYIWSLYIVAKTKKNNYLALIQHAIDR
jgi:hypothetical protein